MARLTRFAVAGYPQHVIQRGSGGSPVFREEADYAAYLESLAEAARASQVAVHAYALLPDRVELLATPATDAGIGQMMQSLGRRFVRLYNDRHGRTGPLWEGRFRAAMLEPGPYLLECSRWIELGPVRAAVAAAPEHYRWSSCAHHVGFAVDPLITDHALVWALGNTPFERQSAYQRWLEEGPDTTVVNAIVAATNRGRALGSTEFLEATGARRRPAQVARSRGRPRRA